MGSKPLGKVFHSHSDGHWDGPWIDNLKPKNVEKTLK